MISNFIHLQNNHSIKIYIPFNYPSITFPLYPPSPAIPPLLHDPHHPINLRLAGRTLLRLQRLIARATDPVVPARPKHNTADSRAADVAAVGAVFAVGLLLEGLYWGGV
jgi:hypothetical protein